MKILLKTSKVVNFFIILYRISRDQDSFSNISDGLIDFKMAKEDRQNLKKTFKINLDPEVAILKEERLSEIYNKNKQFWEEYYKDNLETLSEIVNELQRRLDKFNFEKFKKVERFFDITPKEKINVYVCIGNGSKASIGNAFKPNICSIMPRDFISYSKESLDKDFAVLIHELVHLYQDKVSDEKDFVEIVTRSFAPRGILINKSKIEQISMQKKMLPLIERAIKENKTYFDIRNDLIDIFNKDNK